MGKRSGVLDHEADFLNRPLSLLDDDIARCETMLRITTNARNRNSLESRLHWLSKLRLKHAETTAS